MAYKLTKRIQDDTFDAQKLDKYMLSLSLGVRDIQLCIVDIAKKRCLLIEDYMFENIRTVGQRLEVFKELFEEHLVLKGGFWKEVKCCVKGHKFSLVPNGFYSRESSRYFLSMNSTINPSYEHVYAYQHKILESVNVFAADYKLVAWLQSLYPSQNITLTHQASALIEGILQTYPQSNGKTMYCLLDKAVLHILIIEQKKLFYYNQFSVKNTSDFLKYIMGVFRELGLKQQSSLLVLLGNLARNAPYVEDVRRKVKHVRFGQRPAFLHYAYPFEDLPSHRYFDVFSICLCKGFHKAS